MIKLLAGMTASCIALSCFVSPALAATRSFSTDVNESVDSSEKLESAIINVKSKINVPEELTEFSYNYVENNYSVTPYWNLSWRDKEYNNSITVRCDDDGNIFYYTKNDLKREKSGPKYLKEELIDKALEEVKRITPSIVNNIVLDKITFNGVYSGTYTYNFKRVENGISMPDNTVRVTLKYDTGDITNFSASWLYGVDIPSNEVKITKEEAKEKIGDNVRMSLEYRNKIEEVNGRKVTKAYLVYVPDKTYVAVDAKTGKIYNTHDEFFSMDEYGSSDKLMGSLESANTTNGVNLTEKELAKIEEMKELISKEDAIKIITGEESFYINENAKAVNASLSINHDYLNDEEKGYVWNINISDPRDIDHLEKSSYRANINARVDAKTGKILSFYSNMPSYYDMDSEEWKNVNVKYTREECKEILEKFVKKVEPEKFNKTKLSKDSNNGYLLKIIDNNRIYGGYIYTYDRFNEGIRYNYNNISGSVDGVTGKIYSYSTNWTDEIVFESPKNAMNEKEAYEAYVDNEGFELVYEINNKHYIEKDKKSDEYYDYKDLYLLEKEVRLVHRTSINPAIISPFTGKQLGFDGEVFEDKDEKEYTDISGFWGERYIRLITDLNVNFDGEKFMPNKEITEKEFMSMLNDLGYYIDKKDEEKKDSLTKMEAIEIIVDSLGLSKVAELKDIYIVEFKDFSEIDSEKIGYVALAKALNIVSGDDFGRLLPDKNITRAEAVTMALKLINCNINR